MYEPYDFLMLMFAGIGFVGGITILYLFIRAIPMTFLGIKAMKKYLREKQS